MKILSILAAAVMLICCALPVYADAVDVDVKLPVTAKGAPCTAVLMDAAGEQVDILPLSAEETGYFTVHFSSTGVKRFTVLLLDSDSDRVRYDRTVYQVYMEVYISEAGDTVSVIVLEVEGEGKPEKIVFVNEPIPEETDPVETKPPIIPPETKPVPGPVETEKPPETKPGEPTPHETAPPESIPPESIPPEIIPPESEIPETEIPFEPVNPPVEPDDPTLQTGVLWEPVPKLSVIGIALILFGVLLRGRKKKAER